MAKAVLILGSRGRYGRAAATAFRAAGWTVKLLARPGHSGGAAAAEGVIAGDALNSADIVAAARDCQVIVNAVNAPYRDWSKVTPNLTRSVLTAAAETGATVMVPGNVYVYGAGMPERLTEDTPHRPTTPQGKLRTDMEAAYRAASEAGQARVILLRGGDFIEGARSGNWFDSQIMAHLSKGNILYPGALNLVHAWAYLPDMARAGVMLADMRESLPAYAEFGFPGYAMTGREMVDHACAVVGRKLRVTAPPWPIIRLMALASGDLRAVVQMSYLWRAPHRIDGAKLARTIPDLRETPVREALQESIEALMRTAQKS